MTSNLKTLAFAVVALGAIVSIAATGDAAAQGAPATFAIQGAGPVHPGGLTTQGGGNAAAQRKDKIDLSVCDLATFDFDKCLGG